MYKNSFSLENRKENAILALVHFIRFENLINFLSQSRLSTIDCRFNYFHNSFRSCLERKKCLISNICCAYV